MEAPNQIDVLLTTKQMSVKRRIQSDCDISTAEVGRASQIMGPTWRHRLQAFSRRMDTKAAIRNLITLGLAIFFLYRVYE